jgi:CRP/FNR family transcriptional regulator, cyclic AMP receptor protein
MKRYLVMISGNVFKQLSIFSGFTSSQLALLKPLFIPYECFEGTVLFNQGDRADFLYVLISGEVATNFKPEDSTPIPIARIRPTGVVGLSAAIGRRFYTSTAVCITDVCMLRLRAKDLQLFAERYPEIASQFIHQIAESISERLPGAQAQVYALLKNGLRNGIQTRGEYQLNE